MDDLTTPAVDRHWGCSYGARAELYDRVRPSYPQQALPPFLATPPESRERRRVVDVGAGTGKLTRLLVDAGLDVDAVEPDARMRSVLTQRLPEVRVHAGRGEELPLDDGCVDAVVYGNSWHWVDDSAGAKEARRVLRPGGILVMLWNYEEDDDQWVHAFERLIGIGLRDYLPAAPMLEGFHQVEVTRLRWSREQDVSALPDYALSHHKVAVLPARRREEVLAAVCQLTTQHPDLLGRDQVTVSMQVLRWTYQRGCPELRGTSMAAWRRPG